MPWWMFSVSGFLLAENQRLASPRGGKSFQKRKFRVESDGESCAKRDIPTAAGMSLFLQTGLC